MEHITEFQNGEFLLTTDPTKLDREAVFALLKQTYWADKRTEEITLRAIENSLCFSLFQKDRQIGLIRLVTDYATYAYLCDVIISQEVRHAGLGSWCLSCVFKHPDLQGLRRWNLATKDAQTFYEKFGFHSLEHPEQYMEIFNDC